MRTSLHPSFFSLALLLALPSLGCNPSCKATCDQVVADGCAAPGMEDCDTLCDALVEEATTADCLDEFRLLEYCMGLEPVCAGDSRCAGERATYGECIVAYCEANPDDCSP